MVIAVYSLYTVQHSSVHVSANNQLEISSGFNRPIQTAGVSLSMEQQAIKQELLPALPNSLQGIDVNIALPVDADGELIINQALRDMFELYLSALGEEPLDVIVLRIKYHAAQQLEPLAYQQAIELLERYIAYREELVAVQEFLNEQSEDITQIELHRIRQAKVRAVQDSFFTESEYQGFFDQEATYDDFMMKQMDISQNSELSTEEKKSMLNQLEINLPNDVLSTRQSATQYGDLHYEVTALEQSGATDEEIFQTRLQAVGEESATALAELDQQRAIWQQRVDAYRAYQNEIQSSSLSIQDQQRSLQAWLDERFSSIEQIRVKAITAYMSP